MHPAAESVLSGAGCAAAAEDRERVCLAAAREQEEAATGPAAPEGGIRRERAGQGVLGQCTGKRRAGG